MLHQLYHWLELRSVWVITCMFKKIKSKFAIGRLSEELLYEKVLSEEKSGIKRPGIWGKALADSNGAEDMAYSLYLKYRVQSLKDESELAEIIASEIPKGSAIHQMRQVTKSDIIANKTSGVRTPYFFDYRGVKVYRQEKTWFVGGDSFPSQDEAKRYIDSLGD